MRSKLGVQVLGSVEGHAKHVSCAVPVQETDQQGALEGALGCESEIPASDSAADWLTGTRLFPFSCLHFPRG